jgi:hypothetical protein
MIEENKIEKEIEFVRKDKRKVNEIRGFCIGFKFILSV